MLRCLAAITLMLLGLCPATFADIYQWRDASGKLYFSDKKPERPGVTMLNTTPVNSIASVQITAPPAATNDKSVVMYSTQRCGYCKKARKYFKQAGIAYQDFDIDNSQTARAAYDRLGGRGVPLILVGKARMDGFSEESFKHFYASQTAAPAAKH
jgi:glutaredoxin